MIVAAAHIATKTIMRMVMEILAIIIVMVIQNTLNKEWKIFNKKVLNKKK